MVDRLLEVDRLAKRYGAVAALDELSFEVGPGEIFGFVGPNGAGKTTTMRIILGVLAADSGGVRWAGEPITFADRRRIGYMPEERGLYPSMGVTEQLVFLGELHGMTRDGARAAAAAWLERLGVAGRGAEQLQRLSHGNQQRVQLVAALLHSPEALVLDEPFAGLDPVAVDAMSEVLRDRASSGMTVLFSSHQLELVEQLCDRVGIIRAGRMVACGTVDDLRHSGPERLWVDVPSAPDGWGAELPGAGLVRAEGSRRLFELSPGIDDQGLLRAALKTGPVREFRKDVPSLAELFRQAMNEEAVA
ncbi:MAG TPA: ATP-binding cassette domain-containing protein [Candidatus Binatia bacterium]|nr:ATP-binding cassette domain-containing protein [Candidatus Binatia bacterium]